MYSINARFFLFLKIGVQIFTKCSPDDQDTFRTDDVLSFLEKYPLGLLLYLEFLIHDLKSEVGAAAISWSLINAVLRDMH